MFEDVPGCENATTVKKVHAHVCCPQLPQIFEKEVWKSCSENKSENDTCAVAECFLNTYKVADASGKFDATKAKERLTLSTNKNAAWVRMPPIL